MGHRIITAAILLGLAAAGSSAQTGTTQATRIVGKVTRVDGHVVYIEIESEHWPREGDPVRLGQTMPGFDGIVYMRGYWTVSAVTPDHVVAQPSPDAVGEPSIDYAAEIEAADPQPRPVAEHRDAGSALPNPPAEEIPEWRRQQMADAAYLLGRKYVDDDGVPRDPGAAATHFRAAAELGHSRAAHNLAILLATGDGVQSDPAEAVRWYRYAAGQGLPHSQRELGIRYQNGDGVPQDSAKAMRYLHLAVAQSEPWPKKMASNDIGLMYAKGQGVSQDNAEAMRWFTRAAELGNSWGYFNIAVNHENGWGVPANREIAIRNYQEAARRSNERALQWLRDEGIPEHGPTPDMVSTLLAELVSGDPVKERRAAKILYRDHLLDLRIVDPVADALLAGFSVNLDDGNHVDAIAWMCNILGDSGRRDHAATLKTVVRGSRHKKIKGYANVNFRKLR